MEFVLVPGAWAGGWLWDEVAKHLESRAHKVHSLTLSGMGDKTKSETVGLATHVEDVGSYICHNGIKSAVLVGHSHSGIVVGQVASRARVDICHSIFVEAFLPVSGRSLLEVSGLSVEEEKAAIVNLLASRQKPHPGNTVTEPASLERPLSELSATFIAHNGWLSNSRETDLIEQLKKSRSWQFLELDGGHWPMLSVPRALSEEILLGLSEAQTSFR